VLRPQASSTLHQESSSIPVVSHTVSGVFLQAGAMENEGNANTLVLSLQQQQVPVRISKDSTSHFYKVLVGPFANVQGASRIRVRLQEQGFQTIILRRAPQ
jgi:cell division protein FtsN